LKEDRPQGNYRSHYPRIFYNISSAEYDARRRAIPFLDIYHQQSRYFARHSLYRPYGRSSAWMETVQE
jgi:hypothetical protein